MSSIYDANFYNTISDGSLRSARIVLGFVFNFFKPASLLDVGCGDGAWLAASQEFGLDQKSTLGIDGAYVPAKQFRIDRSQFEAHDLEKSVRLDRLFDMVVSVEVAEHLDRKRASSFVDDLIAHGATVLFSAATPNQGGAHHVNEQWPDYWAALFANAGYLQLDVIRPAIWANTKVDWWYKQNTIIYTSDARVAEMFAGLPSFQGAPLVHPERFAYVSGQQIVNAVTQKLNRVRSRR